MALKARCFGLIIVAVVGCRSRSPIRDEVTIPPVPSKSENVAKPAQEKEPGGRVETTPVSGGGTTVPAAAPVPDFLRLTDKTFEYCPGWKVAMKDGKLTATPAANGFTSNGEETLCLLVFNLQTVAGMTRSVNISGDDFASFSTRLLGLDKMTFRIDLLTINESTNAIEASLEHSLTRQSPIFDDAEITGKPEIQRRITPPCPKEASVRQFVVQIIISVQREAASNSYATLRKVPQFVLSQNPCE